MFNKTFSVPLWRGLITASMAMLLFLNSGCSQAPKDAPEAEKILAAQASMPFQILIPAYLPKSFEREKVEVDTSQLGEGGEPMVQLTYRTRQNEVLFIREWLPVDPALEVLSMSHPIETKWGNGWLLSQGMDMATIWTDIGPLRVSVYTRFMDAISQEDLLEVSETMGPASDQQVFSFVVDAPTIKQAAPPEPVEIKPNGNGVQEFTLVVTPGGYSPLRFSVKKGVPVRIIFKQLGDVGCGNELNLPYSMDEPIFVQLKDADDQQVIEFTPEQTGDFQFFCAHQMYRGVMTVHD